MDREKRPRVAKRFHVAIAFLLVVISAAFAGLALVQEKWAVAGVLVVFLIVAVVMLRQRSRTGEPISFLTTVVRMLGRQSGS